MRIGVVSNIDLSIFVPFFERKCDKEWLSRNAISNFAPAVNTLCISYLKQGCFLKIFTLARETKILKSDKIEIFTISAYNQYPIKYLWGVWINAFRLKKLLSSNFQDLNVLHAHWTYDYAYAASSFCNQIPVFCTVRDWAPYIWRVVTFKDKVTWTFRYLLNKKVFSSKATHFVANSPYTAKLVSDLLQKDIPVIPNSVKDSMFCNLEHNFPKNLRVVTISSGNDKRKNLKTLIKSFCLILNKYPTAELDVICPGLEENTSVVNLWKKQGLVNNRVHFHGMVLHDHLKDFLDGGTVMVCPSLEETFGNTLIEGFSRGIPVIGGKYSGAVPYVLHQGEIGYLCDVRNVKSLAEQIIFVYEHIDEAIVKAKKAKKILKEEFSEIVVTQKYLNYFSEFIQITK